MQNYSACKELMYTFELTYIAGKNKDGLGLPVCPAVSVGQGKVWWSPSAGIC